MRWSFALLTAAALLCGCNNSQQTLNPWAPYGSCRVPAPATNQAGAGGVYYQSANPPRTAVPTIRASSGTPAASAPQQSNAAQVVTSGAWLPTSDQPAAPANADSTVAPVTFNATTNAATSEQGTTTSGGSASSTLRLKGMPVNDATQAAQPAEPAPFTPATQATPLSQVPVAPAGSAVPAQVVTATAQASDSAQPGSPPADAAPGSPLSWR